MKALTRAWTEEIERSRESLVALRRDFHRHPELSFEERRTAEIVAERLHRGKLQVRTGLGRTGVVGVLHGDRPGRTIAWRADIDALPLTETFEAPFASSSPDVMHACGHDGHTAIAITLAEILSRRRAELPGTAVFVFQPAEEVFGGAEPMIAAGALENPRVDEVYGLHLTTQTAVGQVGIMTGPAMASADFFDVTVTGRGGHGAYPHLSLDPITAAANILLGLQNLVSREERFSPSDRLSAGPSTTSSRPAPSCGARCARSTRPSAPRSRGAWPITRPTSRAPTGPRRGWRSRARAVRPWSTTPRRPRSCASALRPSWAPARCTTDLGSWPATT
jgi:metal-dependent amidase/aminoacylase/carboxypeptidase family protein